MYAKLQKRFADAGCPLEARELAEALWMAQFDLSGQPAQTGEEPAEFVDSHEPSLPPPQPAQPTDTGETAQTEAVRLSAVGESGSNSEGSTAREVRLPGVAPLPHALALGRALRPLSRRRASTHRLQMDEEATAEKAAEYLAGKRLIVTPIFRSAPERWYSVAIVIEEGAAMAVWQPAAEELARLFAQHGGFNQVTNWRLRFESGKPPELVSANWQTQPIGSLRRLGERQLVMVMTDGVSTRWSDGRMAQVLGLWGQTSSVVIAQVFGERMWNQTALGEPQHIVIAVAPGSPNRALLTEPELPKNHLPFPVVSLSPELIAEWARMMMQPGQQYSAVALRARPESTTESRWENKEALPDSSNDPSGSNCHTPSAEERLDEFRRLVSDEAYQLAIYLAWLPLALPVMKLVQSAMFAKPSLQTLAEVLLGGIMHRHDANAPIHDPNKLRFRFYPGVRELLQIRIRRDELPPILRLIGDYISRRIGRRFSFTALLPHPDGDKLLPMDDELRQFAEILREGLIRIGLGHLVQPKSQPDPEPPPEEPLKLETFGFTTVTLKPDGKTDTYQTLTARQFVEPNAPELKMKMYKIPAAVFLMGTSDKEAPAVRKEYNRYFKGGEDWVKTEQPQHRVEVPPFYMGKFTITQAQWRIVAGWEKVERELDPNPSYFKDKPDSDQRPVEKINWRDAQEFCARLSVKTGRAYRLPTEAEWEYACRAGTTTPFAFGETITSEFVNYNGEYPYGKAKKGKYHGETVPVGSLGVANSFGLFDMHGNVWEWCEDDWVNNYNDAPDDGSARKLSGKDSTLKLLRGGSYLNLARDCRSACRVNLVASDIGPDVGLRVVVSVRKSSP